MEIETTVDDYFAHEDSNNNGSSIHNEADQMLVSDPFMPSLSLGMNESSTFSTPLGTSFYLFIF